MLFDREPFQTRHIGPDDAERAEMLKVVRASSLSALMDEAIPPRIRLARPLDLPNGESEYQYLRDLRRTAAANTVFRSYIGLGYYDCVTPAVILRNVLENPGWYTPYTPYQAEIAQGRLEALLNFQTMVRDLTAMDVATASLLDQATAAAEAMTLLHRVQARQSTASRDTFWVSRNTFPQTLEVLRGRAEPLGITIHIGEPSAPQFGPDVYAAFVQSPDDHGAILDVRGFIGAARDEHVLVAVASDLLALTLIAPPGELGADVVVGSAQR